VVAAHEPVRYEPVGDGARWRAAERCLAEAS
jgi:hypothetical protein